MAEVLDVDVASTLYIPRDALVELIEEENTDTGWIDPEWAVRIRNLQLPEDTETVEEFISRVKETLRLTTDRD